MLSLALVMGACQIEGLNYEVPDLTDASSGTYDKIFDISADNTGLVRITPVGNGMSKAIVQFGHGSGAAASAVVAPGDFVNHVYPEGEYTVSITSVDLSGKETTNTYPLSVKFTAPTDLTLETSGGGHTLVVTPKAVNAAGGYKVFFGEVEGETGVTVAPGGSATHTYAEAGDYTVSVIALSGGAATTSTTLDITINNPLGLPMDFDTPYTNYNQGGVFGGMGAELWSNPSATGLNTSSTVWKLTKGAGAESWAGTWTPLGEPGGKPIKIAEGRIFKLLVYSDQVGKAVRFQLEDGSEDFKPGVDAVITKANEWHELVFDFTGVEIPANHVFTQFVIQFNASERGEGEVFYLDNISQSN